jgi:putative transposase
MRFEFIDNQRENYAVTLMCQVLAVSPSGYYAWRKRPASQRKMADTQLLTKIEELFVQSRGTYGSPRIHAALRDQGIRCGCKRVARLMRQAGLQVKRKRSYKVTTQSNHNLPVAPNLLKQQFAADKPNQIWLADITYVATAEGWLYLAAVLDLYSRRIVGWSMQPSLNRRLVLAALDMALKQRRPPAGLLHHSDRGSQYASKDYQALLADYDLLSSMSRRGNCYDNAPMESFFASLKTECIQGIVYPTRTVARAELFDYIELFYNRQRIHSQLGYLSPVAYEQLPLVA